MSAAAGDGGIVEATGTAEEDIRDVFRSVSHGGGIFHFKIPSAQVRGLVRRLKAPRTSVRANEQPT